MKQLAKEKKRKLVLVMLGTLIILAGLWFGLIGWQQERMAALTADRDKTQFELDGMKDTLERADHILESLASENARLLDAEAQMASGDLYSWIINTVRDFKNGHPGVDLPQFGTIQVGETTLLPRFPYRQASLTVAGKAHYHDFGRFVADFENRFPYMRLQNLVLEPTTASEGGYTEKLTFRFDIVALVKPEA